MRNPYPKYKYSSTQWFGDIPSHWSVSKLKYKVSCNDSTLPESFDCSAVIKYVEISDVTYENGITSFTELKFQDAPSRARRITRKNDVIISTVRTYLKAIAKIDSDDLIVSTGFAVLRPRDIDSSYLYYVLSTSGFLGEVENHSTGVSYPAITANELENLEIPLPAPYEQKKIAEYLDDVTGKGDALIAEKKRQVDDLRKYRTSLITETVTHGLNPTIPLKDSGIDWLGKIPKGWDIIPLKYLTEEPLMYGANESPELETNLSNPRYIRITDISENGELREDSYRTLDFVKAQPYLLQSGDILFARSGATVGKTYRFDETYPACFAGYLIKARCSSKLNSKFLIYYTNSQSYNNWKNSIFDKSTIQNISADKYNQLPIPLPPIEEQKEIAAYLDEKTGKIDTLIVELEKQLEDLALYKKAVITEAVTGKIDVRDWAPKN